MENQDRMAGIYSRVCIHYTLNLKGDAFYKKKNVFSGP